MRKHAKYLVQRIDTNLSIKLVKNPQAKSSNFIQIQQCFRAYITANAYISRNNGTHYRLHILANQNLLKHERMAHMLRNYCADVRDQLT